MKSCFGYRVIRFAVTAVALFSVAGCAKKHDTLTFTGDWDESLRRTWVGPEYWANRLQDWRVYGGKLECVEGRRTKPVRTVHLLTRRIETDDVTFTMTVKTGLVDPTEMSAPSATGFLVGAGPGLDYRGAALIHHTPGDGGGIIAALESTGHAVIVDFSTKPWRILASSESGLSPFPETAILTLTSRAEGDTSNLTFTVVSTEATEKPVSVTLESVGSTRLAGNLALVSSSVPFSGDVDTPDGVPGGRYWFKEWMVGGSGVIAYPERTCGPVISAQHTLSNGIMTCTAQLMPIGANEMKPVLFETRTKDGRWKAQGTANIISPGYTATVRVTDWDGTRDTPYRFLFKLNAADGSTDTWSYEGTIRSDPMDKEEIVIAGFTGNHNVAHPGVERGIPWTETGVWFPHNDIVRFVEACDPDLLFFSGDQVYEGDSPTQAIKAPLDESLLDYLYKWYLWCWAYCDLARNIPCITIPDDHDVYQGNLWGAGGRSTDKDDKGGYVEPSEFVKMVERTQTSNLPPAYDPTPVEQGIGVYYTSITYGRIGIAVIEDRKFKSGCNGLAPPTTSGRADHFIDPDFDPVTTDVPGAKLLGERQLTFLRDWAADWSGQDMKVAASQTVFANVATHHGPNLDYLAADLDSNGWPQSGRNRALHELRRGFAFMLCGDQHLSTIVHHGIDEFDDAGWSFCVPSIANFYPRAWDPQKDPVERFDGMPRFCGRWYDGLGNRVSLYAATNPDGPRGYKPSGLHDKMPGFGIIRLNKPSRTITMECWPRYADTASPDAEQYEGWPKTVAMEDNYGREAVAWLPVLSVAGLTNPVVQVINEGTGETVYTLRIPGSTWQPKVFDAKMTYTVRCGDPDMDRMQTITNLEPVGQSSSAILEITF